MGRVPVPTREGSLIMSGLFRSRRAVLIGVSGFVCLGTAVGAGAISQVHISKPVLKSFSFSSLTNTVATNYPPYDSARTDVITVNDLTIQVSCPQRGSSATAYMIFKRG